MNARPVAVLVSLAALVALLAAGPARAGSLGSTPGFTPRVPVSAFGLPRDWIDPSRLHVSTLVSMGTGWGSRSMNALQVTTLSYSFKAPVWMSLSVGNAWGPTTANGGQPFFLEGLSVAYRPNPAFQFQVQYQDLRSPLQYGARGFGPWRY